MFSISAQFSLGFDHWTCQWSIGGAEQMSLQETIEQKCHYPKEKKPHSAPSKKSFRDPTQTESTLTSAKNATTVGTHKTVNNAATVIAPQSINSSAISRPNAPRNTTINDTRFNSLSLEAQNLQQEVRLRAAILQRATTRPIPPSAVTAETLSTEAESRLSRKQDHESLRVLQRATRMATMRARGKRGVALTPSTVEDGDWQVLGPRDCIGISEAGNDTSSKVVSARATSKVAPAPKASAYFVSHPMSKNDQSNQHTNNDDTAGPTHSSDIYIYSALHKPPPIVRPLTTFAPDHTARPQVPTMQLSRRSSIESQGERLLALFNLVEAADDPSSLPTFASGYDSEEEAKPAAESKIGDLSFGDENKGIIGKWTVKASMKAQTQSAELLRPAYRQELFSGDRGAVQKEYEATVKGAKLEVASVQEAVVEGVAMAEEAPKAVGDEEYGCLMV